MTVFKRGARYWVGFRYTDPTTGESKRFRRSTGPNTTRREAESLEREWRREVETPAAKKDLRKTAAFSVFAKHWMELKRSDWKPSYVDTVESILRTQLVPHFGDADLRVITEEQVQSYKAQKLSQPSRQKGRQSPVSRKTVNNHLGILSSLFSSAVRWGYCDKNPVAGVQQFRLEVKELPFWDREQSAAYLAKLKALAPSPFPTFFLCALRTGMRLGELLALSWDDVDLVKNEIHVRRNWTKGKVTTPKSGRGRRSPMSAELQEALRGHRHLRGPLVFCNENASYLTYEQVRWWHFRCQRAAGLPRITIHGLRHSFASQLVMAGVPMRAVQELLGHADITTTMRYAHLSPDVTRDAVRALDVGGDTGGDRNAAE